MIHDRIVEFLQKHPKWRAPSQAAVLLWVVLVAGFGFLQISQAETLRLIAKRGNQSACTLGLYLRQARDRALQTKDDHSQSESARARARSSIPQLNVLISSQVTYPANFDCSKLIKQLGQGHVA